MKNLLILILCLLFVNSTDAQPGNFDKIESILKKQLVGQQFLGGMYDLPCFGIENIQITSKGEIMITGSAKGCNRTLFIKDARISTEQNKVSLFQGTPRLNISFYVQDVATLAKAFTDLKNILIRTETEAPVKDIKESKTVLPAEKSKEELPTLKNEVTDKKYSPLFTTYPLAMLESKAAEPGTYETAMKTIQSNTDVKKISKKVGNTNGNAFVFYEKTTQVAELFFNEKNKFYYYNIRLSTEYLDAVNKAFTEKGFGVTRKLHTNGNIEHTWNKEGYPFFYKVQYKADGKKMSMAIIDNNILK